MNYWAFRTIRNVTYVFCFASLLWSSGCGKSGADTSSDGNGAKAASGSTAAAARDSSNPLIGAWTNKNPNAMFSLPDREYTESEMISHDQHWPAAYQIQGKTITVTAEGLPQMTCVMIDDHTMHLTMGRGFNGDMVRYVPLALPKADPTETILTALHSRDFNTLGTYDKNVRKDAAPAAKAQVAEADLAIVELFSLLGHDSAWKVIQTEPGSADRDSISQVKVIQIDFKSSADAPLVESGYLKQAIVRMGLTYRAAMPAQRKAPIRSLPCATRPRMLCGRAFPFMPLVFPSPGPATRRRSNSNRFDSSESEASRRSPRRSWQTMR